MLPFIPRVAGVGMACPLGLRTAPALAAMRAGVTRIVEHELVLCTDGPARACMLSELPPEASRTDRAIALAGHALQETLEILDGPPSEPIMCFVALPAPQIGPRIDPGALLRGLSITAASGAPIPLELGHRTVFESGRAGVFRALQAALAVISTKPQRLCVVGGVDSMADPLTLAELVTRDRLLTRVNPDGIIPGEGAAFLLVGHHAAIERRHARAQILGNHVAQESTPRTSTEPKVSASLGLAAVFRTLRQAFSGRVDEVFAGTTSEIYYGREFSHAYLRNEPLMPEPLVMQSLGNTLGDVGAAAGAIALAQAVARLSPTGRLNGPAPHGSGLAYGSSDSGLVGGAVVGPANG